VVQLNKGLAMLDITDDIISVSDITDRVDELRVELTTTHADQGGDADFPVWLEYVAEDVEEFGHEEAAELTMLEKLLKELCGYGGDHQWEGDWYPQCLIARSHFETYMDEMIADCYEVPKDLPSWMSITLDYVALEQDYSSVDVDGNEYLYR